MLDLVIVGRVFTLVGPGSLGVADAVAIAGGRIVATGAVHHIEELAGPRTGRWRLPSGTCVMPGITDAHLHLGMASAAAMGVRLGGLHDRDAVWAAIENAHADRVGAGDRGGTWRPRSDVSIRPGMRPSQRSMPSRRSAWSERSGRPVSTPRSRSATPGWDASRPGARLT